uniref:BTB domain-containing protein n=1 Tax=Strongyloides papillosus TaxID=174720 RepID=A0A0N5BCB3_STREA
MESMNSADSDVGSNTKIDLKRGRFICAIENFSIDHVDFKPCGQFVSYGEGYFCDVNKLCKECDERKHSMQSVQTFNFKLETDFEENHYFSLHIEPACCYDESEGCISVKLKFHELGDFEVMALCKFSILNAEGKEEYKSVICVKRFDENNDSYCHHVNINIIDLLDRKSMLLPNGRLTLCFEMFYLINFDLNSFYVSKWTHIDKQLNMFLNDMTRMLDSSKFYDCKIKVGNHEMKVHKCILTARSEVFRSTLENKDTEHELDIIEINDFNWVVVKKMVDYLYTGEIPTIKYIAFEMFEIAEKYKVEGLKLIATGSLLGSLDVSNVCKYLEKSEIHSIEILKEFCIAYIYFNVKEVVKSKEWRKIVNFYPSLLERIFNLTADLD